MWWRPQAKKKNLSIHPSIHQSICDLQRWPWNGRRICSLLCGVCVMRTMMKRWRQVLCGWRGGCLGRWRCSPPDWGSCIRCSSVGGPPAHQTAVTAEAATAYPPACEVASLKNLAGKTENMSKVSVCALQDLVQINAFVVFTIFLKTKTFKVIFGGVSCTTEGYWEKK